MKGRYSKAKKEEKKISKDVPRKSIDKAIEKADELRKLDEHNPLEQAMKFEEVRKNPPKPGFMNVEVFEAEDNDGKPCFMSKSETPKGIKWIKETPFFRTDLHSAIEANIAACPSNVGPMLLDQGMGLVEQEKKTFKPKKRKDENMATVIMIIILVGISVGALAFGIMTFL